MIKKIGFQSTFIVTPKYVDMKSFYTLLLVFTTFAIYAQEIVFPDQEPIRINYFDISGNQMFALGTCDHLVYSADGGATMQYQTYPANLSLIDIKVEPNNNRSYVLTKSNLLYFNSDMSLTELNVSSIDNLGDFRKLDVDDTHVYVVSNGAIFSSPHGNLNWSQIATVDYIEDYFITEFQVLDGKIYTGMSEGHIFVTDVSTGGFDLMGKVEGRIRALQMVSTTTGYVTASGESKPMKTTDGGATWSQLPDWPENNPVVAYGENVVISFNTNRYFVSTDGGETNTYVDISDDENIALIYDALFTEDGTLYMAGEASTLISSDDFGLTRTNVTDYFKGDIYAMDIDETGSGAAISSFHIGFTHDDGETWTFTKIDDQISSDSEIYLSDVAYIGNNSALVCHTLGMTIVSDNGTISHLYEGKVDRLYDNGDILLAAYYLGGQYVIGKYDANSNTLEVKQFMDDYPGAFKTTSDGDIYLTGHTGGYYISSDEGENWEAVTIDEDHYILELLIEGDDILYSIGNMLFLSRDAGLSFESIKQGYAIKNLHRSSNGTYAYTTAQSSHMNLFTYNPDSDESDAYDGFCASAQTSTMTADGSILYGLRFGAIVKFPFEEIISSVSNTTLHHSISPTLLRSGSNFNITTEEQITHINIYNQLGMLVSSQVGSGSEMEVSTSQLESGIYFVSLYANGKLGTSKIIITQ